MKFQVTNIDGKNIDNIELSDKKTHEIIYTNKRNGDVRDTLACTKRLSKSYNISDFINFNIGLALTSEFYLHEKEYYDKLHKEYQSYFLDKGVENGAQRYYSITCYCFSFTDS